MNATDILERYATVSLEEMKRVKLMNRTDTKFVTTEDRLMRLLILAGDDYLAQSIGGELIMPYSTLYYDTEDCEMYRNHLHGKLSRKKVRERRYVSSGVEFLEVKRKNNHGRTDKKRIDTDGLSPMTRNDFLIEMSGYEESALKPKIENSGLICKWEDKKG